MRLTSPVTGRPLRADAPHALTDGVERWPVVDGIPFLRVGRDELRARALDRLDAGEPDAALAVLLADQDDWWDGPVPGPDAARRAAGASTLREAMRHLGMGRVGDYFAFRWSDPTFLSGLGLLDLHADGAASAFELGCGAGHLLRELELRGVAVAGADVVFAKLWLARRFVVPAAGLVCFDAGAPWPVPDGAADLALCHDAVHYLPDVPRAFAGLRRVARDTVLVGHAHNATVDNASAGAPLDVRGYAGLLDGAVLYDDAELGRGLVGGVPASAREPEELERSPAIALALGGAPAVRSFALPPDGARLRVNPLLGTGGAVRWPSDRYREEYEELSAHLTAPWSAPDAPLVAGAGRDVDALARRRVLLDLPEAW